jgi:hypothetical protein
MTPRFAPSLRCLACLLALLVLPHLARADDAQIYLSWHAPWGEPGATDTLTANCDTTQTDTLWLSFDPGRTAPTFLSMGGDLLFHPAVGDTLSDWWLRNYGMGRPPFIGMEMDPQPGLGYEQPYRINGGGGTAYFAEAAGTRLAMIYATPYMSGVGVVPKRYVYARLLLKRPASVHTACHEPVCIEWADADLYFDSSKSGTVRVVSGGHRFVSLNSPGGAVSRTYEKAAALRTWKPQVWDSK